MFLMAVTAFSCSQFGSKNWAVKIDDDTISMDEFERFYYTQNKLLLNIDKNEEIDKLAADPSLLNPQLQQYIIKANFLDHLVAQRLLFKKALSDKTVSQKELETIQEIAKMQAVATYYLGTQLKDSITVTDEEVDKFYRENIQLFKGVPMNDSVISRIKQQIFMQKSSALSNQYIMNLLAESKVNKEGFKNYMKEQEAKKGKEASKPTEGETAPQ